MGVYVIEDKKMAYNIKSRSWTFQQHYIEKELEIQQLVKQPELIGELNKGKWYAKLDEY